MPVNVETAQCLLCRIPKTLGRSAWHGRVAVVHCWLVHSSSTKADGAAMLAARKMAFMQSLTLIGHGESMHWWQSDQSILPGLHQ